MSIENITSAAYNTAGIQSGGIGAGGGVRPPRRDEDGDGDRGPQGAERGRDAEQFVSAVTQALSAVGIQVPAAAGATDSGSTGGDSGNGDQTRQAVRELMHQLFQSLRPQDAGIGKAGTDAQANGAPAPAPEQAGAAYGSDFSTQLQNLVQSVASPNVGGARSEGLRSAFANLVQATRQEDGSSGAAQQQPELQNFLKNLAQNLQSANPVGGAVNTLA